MREVALGGHDCVIKTDFGERDGCDGGALEAWDGSKGRVKWAEVWQVSHNAQIQDTVMLKDHVYFFLEKYKDKSKYDYNCRTKSKDNYNHIYWRGLGQVHNKLTNTKKINTTKYLNRWPNTSRQQGRFGEASEYPCCR